MQLTQKVATYPGTRLRAAVRMKGSVEPAIVTSVVAVPPQPAEKTMEQEVIAQLVGSALTKNVSH